MERNTQKEFKKSIVVIGANSYIARNLIFALRRRNDVVIKGLYDIGPKQVDNECDYEQIDPFSKESLEKIDFSSDIIFDFIGKTGTFNGFDNYKMFIDVNEVSLLNILDEYRRQDSKGKIIFPSTRLVYKGKTTQLKEEDVKEFKTIYALNKFACEKYLEQYHNVFNIEYCIFRICVPYGSLVENANSYGTADMMLSKAKEGKNIVLYGDGSVRRTITYIGDLCNALIDGALSDSCKNNVFNIGGEDYSLKEMAILISEKYKVDIDYVEWPINASIIESGDTVFNDEKIRKLIGPYIKTRFKDWVKN